MSRSVSIIGALVMAAGVLLVAAGAHLVGSVEAEKIWRSANQMQLMHGLGLCALGLFRHYFERGLAYRLWQASVFLMCSGITLFCVTLYLKVLGTAFILPAYFAPSGGMSFFFAWLMLAGALVVSPKKTGATSI